MIQLASYFLVGALFAVGLAVGGMTQPAKVTGFLDVTGRWDASLAFVMAGAILVYAPAYRLIRRRAAPWLAPRFMVPTRLDLDGRLVFGAALFGVGWAIGGYCPGPAITAVSTGSVDAVLFVSAMLAGQWLHSLWARAGAEATVSDSEPRGERAEPGESEAA